MKQFLKRLNTATTMNELYEIELDAEKAQEHGSLSVGEYEYIAGVANYLAERMEDNENED